jgi:RNA polymerase sigma factor (sigma-70 family)
MQSRIRKLQQNAGRATSARRLLVDRNRYLVIPIAREYTDQGMDLMDLVEEGNHGLRRAVEQFDWRSGNRFSTHAEPFIRKAIIKGLRGARL